MPIKRRRKLRELAIVEKQPVIYPSLRSYQYRIVEVLSNRPKIVCLCGSTRFGNVFAHKMLDLTLQGYIVLSIGCNMKSDTELFGYLSDEKREEIKTKLDELHLRKIDLADEVFILNVDGYIGDSTRSEIEYAKAHGKPVKYLEPIK